MNKKKVLVPIIIFTTIIIFLIIILNPSKRYKKLSITENKWNSIKNAKTENKNLVLEDINFNDYNLIIDENSDTIYYSAVNDSKNKYNPSVSYTTKNKNVKLVFLADEITDEKVKSNYKFKMMIYNENDYHIYDLICTDLPILNIKYKEAVGDKQKNIPMEIYLFNNLTNTPNKITISNGKLKINENNYIFSLNMTTPGKNIRDNKISILNMKPNSEYILTAINNNVDNAQESAINEENTQKAEINQEDNIQQSKIKEKEPKNHRIELFINNEYKGVYSLEYVQKQHKKEINQN